MNPLKLLKLAAKANKLISLIQQGSTSYERNGQSMSKSLFASKTFWFNVLTAASELSGVLSGVLPAGTVTIAASVLNIALRVLTHGPVHVLHEAGKK